jgi:YVTN family beta-propeller protein
MSLIAALAMLPIADPYWVCVSNERSGDVTVIDGATKQVVAAIPVGKRPRGLHASADGKRLYVAVSGSPISGPPKLDAKGNPVFEPEDEKDADRSADGIAIVDLDQKKFLGKINAGSDPEEFAVSRDGKRLYVANEDVGTMSVVNVETGDVDTIVRVQKEPEGVSITPDGKFVWITCETNGEVVVVSTETHKPVGEIAVGGRPRTVAFSADGSRAYIPSETAGTITTVDAKAHKIIATTKLPDRSRPMGTALSPDGSKLFVSTGRAGKVCVLDTASMKLLANIEVGQRPWGVGLSPDGSTLFVANGPSNDVSVVDASSMKQIVSLKAGRSPWGLCIVSRRTQK